MRVWARRYPDDQGLPQPDWSHVSPEYAVPQRVIAVETDAQRMALIKAHDSYIVPMAMWSPRRQPEPGDLVWVTFDDILNQKRGRLLDFTDPGSNPPSISNWATAVVPGAAGKFSDLSEPISSLFEEDRGPQIRPPTPEQMKAANEIVEKMCPGPYVKKPNDLELTQAGPPYVRVQTIIWESSGPSAP